MERVGMLLRLVSNRHVTLLDRELRAHGVTGSQALVLGYLNEHRGEPVYQRDISAAMGVRHTSTIDVLSRLEAKGCVTRCVNPENRRARIVSITQAGIDLVSSVEELCDRYDRLVAELFGMERAELAALLERALEQLGDDGGP